MKRIPAILTVLFCLSTAGTAVFSQSLSELAQKEKERRQGVKNETKAITNDDAVKAVLGPVTTGSAPSGDGTSKATSEKPGAGTEAQPGSAKTAPVDEPLDLQGRSESFWRQTLGDARKTTKELANLAIALELRIADLQNQFYRESSGFKQQEIQREIQKAFFEQDLNKEHLTKAKRQLEDLETEARKSGALPGWLR